MEPRVRLLAGWCFMWIAVSSIGAQTAGDYMKDYAEYNRILRKVQNEERFRNSVPSLEYIKEREPHAFKTTMELISGEGYPVELHEIVTEDGYIIGLHRIPHGRNATKQSKPTCRKPVLLGHGVLLSSASFVLNRPDRSIGFMLADAGYDVWMVNFRGSLESQRHIRWKVSDKRFWDGVDIDEMGHYDIPASIDYVLKKTNDTQVYYIGFSMGTISCFEMTTFRPEYAKKVKMFVGMAPFGPVTSTNTPLRLLVPYDDDIQNLVTEYGLFRLLAEPFGRLVNQYLCFGKTVSYCKAAIMFVVGEDSAQLNTTRVPIIMHHVPAGFSYRTFRHGFQLVRKKRFELYDLGPEANMVKYGQAEPPKVDLSKFRVPSVLFYGTADKMVTVSDAELLIRNLPLVMAKYKIPGWTHGDFLWAQDMPKMHNNKIIEILNQVDRLPADRCSS